jgi:RimJ/RimL family protein N-acetyltransferase
MYLPLRHCTLRDWGAADREALVRYANNAAIARNLRDRFPHPYGEADAERFLSLCEQQSPRTFFAIAVGAEAVGGIGIALHDDIERVAAELGYWLGEPFWGRGIVSEAVAALTEWAFSTLPLTRVYALPFAHNLASARVLEKAGFALEGRMRACAIKNGQIVDQLMYARLREPAPVDSDGRE